MKWFYNLERKFGKFAIRNLMTYVTILAAVGLVLQAIASLGGSNLPYYILYLLTLNNERLIHGQVWRLITFLIVPTGGNIFVAILMTYIYWQMGTTLEKVWGSFRFNLYYFSGIIGTVLAAIICYFVTGGQTMVFTASFINLSLFMAYAFTFPNETFLVFFIIPVRAKILGYLDIILYVGIVIFAVLRMDWAQVVEIIVSMINFIIFFILIKKSSIPKPKQVKKQIDFRREVKQAQKKSAAGVHRCCVCGVTEEDRPDLSFRYCSKCEGNSEYCSEHLYTHVHIKKSDMYSS